MIMDHTQQLNPGEIFVGNTNVEGGIKIPEHLNGLKTARLGDQAYDINGEAIDHNYMRPLFIDESEAEAYDKIMMDMMREIRRK